MSKLSTRLLVVAAALALVIGGGYFAVQASEERRSNTAAGAMWPRPDPFRLDLPQATFFGLEEGILRQVVNSARGGFAASRLIESFDNTEFFYSGFSVLRDGSSLAPVDFFEPVEQIVL